ncbi:MAG TPA: HAD family hydrolase [Planctomycetaceae bacterium]|nr:HAD family hydrolase [Planctomycetaceae bacterium]
MPHEHDYQRRVTDIGPTRFLPGTAIEIVREVSLTEPPRHAVFDFDGTLSLIREGWPEVMVPLMVEVLRGTGTAESDDELAKLCLDFIMQLNGKQTIYQMIRLADEVRQRGGSPQEPIVYKQQYHDRLLERIEHRRGGLRSGRMAREECLVPGAIDVLRELQARGVATYLASGTDEVYVREEADLLGLTPFFGRHIYGARDDFQNFSKQMIIERILQENAAAGSRLIGFGDGYVEIDNIKTAGGTAVAVASDEKNKSGRPDPWKRDRLIGVGADVVIPDYRDAQTLLDYLWPKLSQRSRNHVA